MKLFLVLNNNNSCFIEFVLSGVASVGVMVWRALAGAVPSETRQS
jgi:hypothetical protein